MLHNTHTDPLSVALFESPVGELRLVASRRGLRAVLWPGDIDRSVDAGATSAAGADAEADALLVEAARQLREYFAGDRREFDVPLDPVGTEFQQAAWTVLRGIPYGETISYGEQARRLGDVNKSRAVGAANGRNPISIIVPCHRVVGSTGKLTGFAGGLDTKAWLLGHEQGAEHLPL
ncbi:MAG: methylated-DNA--[protein]-cysteine S-methyltransferase [Actinomycetota bacterium]